MSFLFTSLARLAPTPNTRKKRFTQPRKHSRLATLEQLELRAVLDATPVAGADVYFIHGPNEQSVIEPLSISAPGVLENDVDADVDDTLTAVLLETPNDGSVTLNPDGSFIYTPFSSSTVTSDFFSYYASDGQTDPNACENVDTGESCVNTVHIFIGNEAPVAVQDSASVLPGTSTIVDVLANDTDPQADSLSVHEIEGTLVNSNAITTIPTDHGTVTVSETGVVTYQPNSGYTGFDFFEYRAADEFGGVSEIAVVSIEIASTSSVEAEIIGAPISSIPGRSISLSNGADNEGDVTYTWTVERNGTFYTSGSGETFTFTPDDTGGYHVILEASNVDGSSSDDIHIPVVNAINEGGHVTVALGPGGHTVTISSGSIIVQVDSQPPESFEATAVTVHGGTGDDTITVASTVTTAVTIFGGLGNDIIVGGGGNDAIYGGSGNDQLKGGAGADLVLGEDGNDIIVGGLGRDVLIGGDGADAINGNAEDDILISGLINFVDQDAALTAIRNEWKSNNSFLIRTANIAGWGPNSLPAAYRLNSSTVTDDNAKDTLAGDQGTDWYFANLWLDQGDDADKKDKIVDINLFELLFANDLDF